MVASRLTNHRTSAGSCAMKRAGRGGNRASDLKRSEPSNFALMKFAPMKLLVSISLLILVGCAAIESNQGEIRALREKVQALERRFGALASERTQTTIVLARARGAVAHISASYTFVDSSGRPLRHVLNEAGKPIVDARGIPLVTLGGKGSVAVTEYWGTGFLVRSTGELLTNRHIAEPWWEDKASAPLLASGLKPVFLRLRAFFQDYTEPVSLEVVRVHEEQDIAVVRTVGWIPEAAPLPLLRETGKLKEGQPVILIGYTTGSDAIIAKLDWPEQARVEAAAKDDEYAITEELARTQQLRPTATGGHLWEILPTTLVSDARTGAGGSGGPLLDHHGRVIGVSEAYLPNFSGGNYAVPARFAAELVDGGGTVPLGPRQETPVILLEPTSSQRKGPTSGSS